MDFFESAIKTYSGLSTETKPLVSAGTSVPNGSRWREVDTDKAYIYNLSDDTWHEIYASAGGSIFEGSQKKQLIQDNNSVMILTSMLKELKKINLHLSFMTDNSITNTEVE